MDIENRNNLIDALTTGANIFVGAGFSLLAEDKQGRSLPLGWDLKTELEGQFQKKASTLTQLATILKATKATAFSEYLTERFTVKKFSDKYKSLNQLDLRYVFTTNIDNLVPLILSNHATKYVHDLRKEGESDDPNAIHYLPLHGNVDSEDQNYIFTTTEIANIFDNSPRIWNFLTRAVEKYPTIFLGYGMNDTSTIQAITSGRYADSNIQKSKWILLKDPADGDIEYFRALGFKIIKGDIEEFLSELPGLLPASSAKAANVSKEVKALFKSNLIPDSGKGLRARSILHFFRGMEPIWGDVLSGNICRTTHFDSVMNALRSNGKNTIIIGTPLCGKTTLAMQVAVEVKDYSLKLMFEDMTETKARYIAKLLGNERAFILIDNVADDIEAYNILAKMPNIKILGLARSLDYGIVSHLVDKSVTEVLNVTELTDTDFQKVFKSLPAGSRQRSIKVTHESKYYKRDTIFEFVLNNIKGESIKERYKSILESSGEDQVLFMVLCAYMHYCRIPLSLELALSFFSEKYDYTGILEIKSVLDDMLKELDETEDLDNIDYYNPRSAHLADVIINSTPSNILREVLWGIIRRVPQVQIPRYNIFRRRAFDHRIIRKAFKVKSEGDEFYGEAFRYDYDNPYILQQHALFLSSHKDFAKAFSKIDKAMVMTNNKQFSIRNTHAIILFEANCDTNNQHSLEQLDESMRILKKCYEDDKRKTYHAEVFSEQAIRYYKIVQNEATLTYLTLAKKWLTEEIEQNPWHRECRRMKDQVCKIIDKAGMKVSD